MLILITPAPTTGAHSTSPNADRRTYFKEIAKDALVCALDALVQSSDACAPLKSVAGGLMFCINWADVSMQSSSPFVCADGPFEAGVE